MDVLINYANKRFRGAQLKNSRSGYGVGGFDVVKTFSPNDLSEAFCQENKNILRQELGAGYWIWKPYIIRKVLSELGPEDRLFYCDSGAHFVSSAGPLLDLVSQDGRDIAVFDLTLRERAYTKRDAFVLLGCDQPEYTYSLQRLAGYHIWRRSSRTIEILNEWLEYLCDPRLSTDLENQCGLPNYPEFKAHRHDQSIFSLLTKKYEVEAFRDPSQFGNDSRDAYPNSPYPQILDLTRDAGNYYGRLGRLRAAVEEMHYKCVFEK